MSERNKAQIRRIFRELFNDHRLELIDELYAPDCRFTDTVQPGELQGTDTLREMLEAYRAAVPDLHYELRRLLGEGETVVAHWRVTGTLTGKLWGQRGTGRRFRVDGMSFAHFAGGRVAHVEQLWDLHSFLRQVTLDAPDSTGLPRNSELLAKFFDRAWTDGSPPARLAERFDDLWAEDSRAHGVVGQDLVGREAIKGAFLDWIQHFDRRELALSESFERANRAGARLQWRMRHIASGRDVDLSGFVVARYDEAGRIVEAWFHFDHLSMLIQTGSLAPETLRQGLAEL